MPRTMGPSGGSIISDSGLAFLEDPEDSEFIEALSLLWRRNGGGGYCTAVAVDTSSKGDNTKEPEVKELERE